MLFRRFLNCLVGCVLLYHRFAWPFSSPASNPTVTNSSSSRLITRRRRPSRTIRHRPPTTARRRKQRTTRPAAVRLITRRRPSRTTQSPLTRRPLTIVRPTPRLHTTPPISRIRHRRRTISRAPTQQLRLTTRRRPALTQRQHRLITNPPTPLRATTRTTTKATIT